MPSSSAVAARSTAPGLRVSPPPPKARGLFLCRQRARLEREAAAVRRELTRPEEETERLADPADEAQRIVRCALRADLFSLATRRLRAIQEAIEAIEIGDYGVCIDCEEQISRRRLELAPWARRCVACQEAAEEGEAT